MKSKKLLNIIGNSGRWHKMYLHKVLDAENVWYITENVYDRMNNIEPFGWEFDTDELREINCEVINVHMKEDWMEDWILWRAYR